MKGIELTSDLAYAAGTDAGNASKRRAGRSKWNEDDYNEAVRVTNNLLYQLESPEGQVFMRLHGLVE